MHRRVWSAVAGSTADTCAEGLPDNIWDSRPPEKGGSTALERTLEIWPRRWRVGGHHHDGCLRSCRATESKGREVVVAERTCGDQDRARKSGGKQTRCFAKIRHTPEDVTVRGNECFESVWILVPMNQDDRAGCLRCCPTGGGLLPVRGGSAWHV